MSAFTLVKKGTLDGPTHQVVLAMNKPPLFSSDDEAEARGVATMLEGLYDADMLGDLARFIEYNTANSLPRRLREIAT